LLADTCSSNNEECEAGSSESDIHPKPEQHRGTAEALGPLLADLHGEEYLADGLPNQDECCAPEGNDTDDDEYEQVLADRARLLDDEASRQRVREELEAYVGSLSSRTDENGEHLVEFPRNYQQIVALMTEKDVREDDATSQDGKPTRQSWSRVLIESGLSKQQAFVRPLSYVVLLKTFVGYLSLFCRASWKTETTTPKVKGAWQPGSRSRWPTSAS
jgi:hypothetical protein